VVPHSEDNTKSEAGRLLILSEDGERALCRMWRTGAKGTALSVLAAVVVSQESSSPGIDRLAREYELRDDLKSAWAARPLELIRNRDQAMLLLEDPGGSPLDQRLIAPMEIGHFLRLAIGIAAALDQVHQSGLIHKDLRPANILVDGFDGHVRLTGFGLASRLPHERQAPGPPEIIAGTMAYMAPEQTGRMNRSIDCRSDLYALGVTFYQMLTGTLPFNASDPMEWVHCHLARQPQAPDERSNEIPGAVSAIVMKLLAKSADDRYQTATGLESDLRRCQSAWRAHRRITQFNLGEHDAPDRLLIPEKLYGRRQEAEILLAAYDRVARRGTPELVLVSGYSGIGKSSVVNELQTALTLRRGLFASGKFDQYKRDIPYSILAQAFQSLIRPLLGKGDAELAPWRDAWRDALEPNAALIAELVPEIKSIIGEPPPVPDLPPRDAQRRFQTVIRRFITTFSRDRPLALFLDDLHWADAATLELVEHLLTHTDVRHLLLIGAYRDNEVTSAHPLMRALERIRNADVPVQGIVLGPLILEHAEQLIADSLRCDRELAAPLAAMIYEKTAGNPFFIIQFLKALFDERLLTFAHSWRWDLNLIHAKGYTDNIIDFMLRKINRLPHRTQTLLQRLACLGNGADFSLLAIVCKYSVEKLHDELSKALQTQLIVISDGTYHFVHDRIQEAAYLLIPENRRAETHLRIGRLLAKHTSPEKRDEIIFEIVNQLNRGASLISSTDEIEKLAELNLVAGKRAKAATAYSSALVYLATGMALLSDEGWERRPELMFALNFHRAESEFLTGNTAKADERLIMLSARTGHLLDRSTVAALRIDLYTNLGWSDRSIDVCLTYLRHLGINWSSHPAEEEVQLEYKRTWVLIGRRNIDDLLGLPLMEKPEIRATMDVLIKSMSPALFTDVHLHSLIICRMVNLSIEHGNTDVSCHAYIWLGAIVGPRFGDYEPSFQFGRLGYNLGEHPGLGRSQFRAHLGYGVLIVPWIKHIRCAQDLIRRAFKEAFTAGDLLQAVYSCTTLFGNLFVAAEPLVSVQAETERSLAFAKKAHFGLAIDATTAQLALVHTLRGSTQIFGCFNSPQFDEQEFERHLSNDLRLRFAACWYWVRKLQARFFAGDYAAAIEASSNAQRLLWISSSFIEAADAHFYGALSRAAACNPAFPAQYRQHADALAAHHKQLQQWAENCPENFDNRAWLVGAEIARIEGRYLDAERLYEAAIRAARESEFVNNEAIANELAAGFYAKRGFETIARAYLREARNCYLRWGADGKVHQLDALHPFLRDPEPIRAAARTLAAPLEHLDFATVVKVSKAVSGKMVLERLIDSLMRLAIEHAGAERGLLLLTRGHDLIHESEAVTDAEGILVHRRVGSAAPIPDSVIHYVARTREILILDDASSDPAFSEDPYIRERCAKSILCLPLLNEAKLIGLLYLENNLTTYVFTSSRIAVLKLLALQAAISLENTYLYNDLAEREAKIRRLVDANIIGIYIIDLEGRILEANDAFLQMVGYQREDLDKDRLRWIDLTPPEWRGPDARRVGQVKATGSLQPFEKEYFRKDGSRVPVLVGVARFESTDNKAVVFAVDLTKRKQAEAEARDSERRLGEAQMELARANRVAAAGYLSASIGHEINQPLSGVITNAETAGLWLKAKSPNVEQALAALDRVIRDGKRISDIVNRIRALIKRVPPPNDSLDINEAILEVVDLSRNEAAKTNVLVQTQLGQTLPLVRGDKIQLQQVVLNLTLNAIEALADVDECPREVLISTQNTESGGIVVDVSDSGRGLDPASLSSVFDAFYTTKSNGLGLGLSICRSIVEAHGGKLWATSGALGGAAFQFTLPAGHR
jgi:PAS domain S-box-containing protein